MRRIVWLAAAGALALTLGTAGAYFTSQTLVQENVIRAGMVEVSAEPTSAALGIESLAPGQSVTRSMRLRNEGTLACDVVVTAAKKMGITDFYESLTCKVLHEGTTVYSGPMSALRTDPVTLGKGAVEDLEFQVRLPAEAGNELAGDYVKLTLYIDAEQEH